MQLKKKRFLEFAFRILPAEAVISFFIKYYVATATKTLNSSIILTIEIFLHSDENLIVYIITQENFHGINK